jgi:hypothetical protein
MMIGGIGYTDRETGRSVDLLRLSPAPKLERITYKALCWEN